jgi:hypothetical protein
LPYSLLDELLQQLGELLGVVGAIDNGGAGVLVVVRLGTQLTAVELEDVCVIRQGSQGRR